MLKQWKHTGKSAVYSGWNVYKHFKSTYGRHWAVGVNGENGWNANENIRTFLEAIEMIRMEPQRAMFIFYKDVFFTRRWSKQFDYIQTINTSL